MPWFQALSSHHPLPKWSESLNNLWRASCCFLSWKWLSVTIFSLFFFQKKKPSKQIVNSLAPGKFEWNFKYLILQIISVIDGWGISCELALRWMSLDLTDDKSTLVQVMAWCRQATSHYLSQCWPRSLSPYGVTRPQWVKTWLATTPPQFWGTL